MGVKRKRETIEASVPKAALPPVNLSLVEKALKSEDAATIQGACVSCLKLFSACRKAETRAEASEQVSQHASSSISFGKAILAALHHAAILDNRSLLITVLNTVTSFVSLAIVSLISQQRLLIKEVLSEHAQLLSRSLGQGRNDLNAVTLKLLGVIARDTADDSWATRIRRIWSIVSGDTKNVVRLLSTRQKQDEAKKRSDLRTLALAVVLPIASSKAPLSLRLDLLNMPAVVAALFKGLEGDTKPTISAALQTVFLGLVNEQRIPAELRAVTAEASWITALHLLEIAADQGESESRSTSSIAFRFILASVESLQAAYRPGSTDRPLRRALVSLLSELKYTDSQKHFTLVLRILEGCPNLLSGFWHKIFPSLEPRQSTKWMVSMNLVSQILSLPFAAPNIDSCFPSAFTKTWLSKGLQSDNALLQHVFCLLVSLMLHKCKLVGVQHPPLASKIATRIAESLPDAQVVVSLVQKAQSPLQDASQNDDIGIFGAVRLLNLYFEAAPETVRGLRFDVSKIASIALAKSERDALYQALLVHVLRLVGNPKTTVQWLKGAKVEDTILYQLLQLQRATDSPLLRGLARQTILSLLCGSSLFDVHQRFNAEVWLDALETCEGQREQVETFWVACAQRADNMVMKYIEAGFEISGHSAAASDPLLACWFEQIPYQDAALHAALSSFTAQVVLNLAAISANLKIGQLYAEKAATLFVASKAGKRQLKALQNQLAFAAGLSSKNLKGRKPSEVEVTRKNLAEMALTFLATGILTDDLSDMVAQSSQSQIHAAISLVLLKMLNKDSMRSEQIAFLQALITKTLDFRWSAKQSVLLQDIFDKALANGKGDFINEFVILIQLGDSDLLPAFAQQLWQQAASLGIEKYIEPLGALYTHLSAESRSALAMTALTEADSLCGKESHHFFRQVLDEKLRHSPADTYSSAQITNCAEIYSTHRLKECLDLCKRWLQCSTSQISPVLAKSWSDALLHDLAHHGDSTVSELLGELIYRSPDASAAVHQWLLARPASDFVQGPLCDLQSCQLQVLRTLSDTKGIHALFDRLALSLWTIAKDAHSLKQYDVYRVLTELVAAVSIDKANAFMNSIRKEVESLEPQVVNACLLTFLSGLAHHLGSGDLYNTYAHKSCLWLVRRFAEDDEDSPDTTSLVSVLLESLEKHSPSLQSHFVDPVIIAAIQRRPQDSNCLILARLLFACTPDADRSKDAQKYTQILLAHPSLAQVLAEESTSRLAALRFFQTCYLSNPSQVSQSTVLRQLLPFYSGTRSPSDLVITEMLRHAELNEVASIASLFEDWLPARYVDNEMDAKGSSLLCVFDQDRMWRTCLAVIGQTLSDSYDLHLIHGLFSAYLNQPEIKIRQFIGLMRVNVLGVLICGLASQDTTVARSSDRLLAKLRNRLQGADFPEVEELVLVLNHLTHWSQSDEPVNSVPLLFMARCVSAIAAPESKYYTTMMRHLLQRAFVEGDDVPLLYQLMYPQSESDAEEDRLWMLSLIRDGMAKPQDWTMLRRRQTWELLSGYFASSTSSQEVRASILEFLLRASQYDAAVEYLIRRSGIFLWLSTVEIRHTSEHVQLVNVLHQCVQHVCVPRLGRAETVWLSDAVVALASLTSKAEQPAECHSLAVTLRRLAVKSSAKNGVVLGAITRQNMLNTADVLFQVAQKHTSSSLAADAIAYIYDSVLRIVHQSDISNSILVNARSQLSQMSLAIKKQSPELLAMRIRFDHAKK